MKLKNLINCKKEFEEIEITGITCDSRAVKQGYAFVCITGFKIDGHEYYASAVEKGAVIIITERDLGIENQIEKDIIELNKKRCISKINKK